MKMDQFAIDMLNKVIIKYHDAFYFIDYYSKVSLKFTNNKWIEFDFNLIKDVKEDYSLNSDEIRKLFYDNSPLVLFNEIQSHKADKLKQYFDNLIKLNEVSVIGWLSPNEAFHLFKKIKDEKVGDLAFAALINDIRNHHYLLQGEDYQNNDLVPVFSNGTYEDYSLRGFSSVLAASYDNDYSSLAYSKYMFHSDKLNLPKYGYYYKDHKEHTLYLEEALFKEIIKANGINNIEESCYLFPLDKDDELYRNGDIIHVINKKEKKCVELKVHNVLNFQDLEEFSSFINERNNYSYLYKKDLIEEYFNKNKDFNILFLSHSSIYDDLDEDIILEIRKTFYELY